jgi:hypothetical protein
MANERYILVRVPELPELSNVQAGTLIVGYDTATGRTVKINVNALGGGEETDITWRNTTVYAENQIVEYGLKLWKSLQNDNTGNFPSENTFWTEVSKAGAGSNITNYTPGVYTYEPTLVLRQGRLYFLAATKPFESVNFTSEAQSGAWQQVNRSNLIAVVHLDNIDGAFFLEKVDDTLIVLISGTVEILNGDEQVAVSIAITKPSFIVKTGLGFTSGDYTVISITGNHNSLDGIQGGALGQHYHVTANQAEALEGANAPGPDNPYATQNDLGGGGLPSTWEQDAAAIRALTVHDNGMDVGNYATNTIYEYDAAATAADDGDVYLKPNDVGSGDAGRWIKKKTFLTAPANEVIQFAVSDEDTPLTAGTNKMRLRMPFAMTLTGVRASVNVAPTDSTIIIDINESGTSILSTKLSIDATEKTSTTAATQAVISDTSLASDTEISIDVDQVGMTIAGAGLKITLIGTRG